MTDTNIDSRAASRLADALQSPDAPTRLQAALTAGTHANPAYLEVLIARCRVEPDFYVRDMLTWALTRHDRELTVDLLLPELGSATAQARSQALHSLSKIGDPRAWPAITASLLTDDDGEVARAAWRTAAGLAPDEEKSRLSDVLITQFARGDRDLQLSLSRAFVTLGAPAAGAVEKAATYPDPQVRIHAIATAHLMDNPDDGFDAAVAEARKVVALRAAPRIDE
ncbi:HEAT repeat domain-containing protein [Microbacterium sp. PMB16]|uniref:HEAT repeat domain-containing protein n=1 Tax=Microbacterium sp. PMB16 TaxID=3120157 RepID=UPI003F4B6A59